MSKHSVSCPSPDLLVALDEGVLPETLAATVAEHLNTCAICTALRRDLTGDDFATPTAAELTRVRTRVFPRRAFARILAIAAAVIIVISVYAWRSKPQQALPERREVAERKVSPAYRLALAPAPLRLPFAKAMVLRGKGESNSQDYLKELGKALTPYRAGSYAEAASQLAELRGRYPKAVEPPFYQGVALLLAGESSKALDPLSAAQSIGGEALNDDIAWYLAVAYERNAAWEKADALLRSLCGSEGVHREAACTATARR